MSPVTMSPAEHSRTPIAVVKTQNLVLWLLPKAEKFARTYRFTMGHSVVIRIFAFFQVHRAKMQGAGGERRAPVC